MVDELSVKAKQIIIRQKQWRFVGILLLVGWYFAACNRPTGTRINPTVDSLITPDTTTGAYSDPALIFGTDFGTLFQTYYKFGKYSEMVSFTSSKSLDEHGRHQVLEYYSNMAFGYSIRLIAINKQEDGIFTLTYETQRFATRGILRMDVSVENDSCKLILNDTLETTL